MGWHRFTLILLIRDLGQCAKPLIAICCLKVLHSLWMVSFSLRRSIERVIEKEPIWSERRTFRQNICIRLSEHFRGHPAHCESEAGAKSKTSSRALPVKFSAKSSKCHVGSLEWSRFNSSSIRGSLPIFYFAFRKNCTSISLLPNSSKRLFVHIVGMLSYGSVRARHFHKIRLKLAVKQPRTS